MVTSICDRVLVIGIGNHSRGDDGAGIHAVRLLRGETNAEILEMNGEAAALINAWEGASAVILIDAVHSGRKPGTIIRLDAHAAKLPGNIFHCSTHSFGLAEALELARALRRLPPRFVIYGIEGAVFEAGAMLSDEVQIAAREVAERVRHEIERMNPAKTR